VASGELVQTEILTGPDLAKIVTSDGTAPVVTDGPFQEFKEWLAGFQVVDVDSEARALEIAAKVSAVPGPNGVPTQQPIQVRQVMEQGPQEGVPESPRAWLLQTATRRLIDQYRSDRSRREREVATIHEPQPAEVSDRDDALT